MSKIYKFILIIFVFNLFSCTFSSGSKSAVKLYQSDDLEKGTRLSEITKKYGNYSARWQDKNGNNLYQYSYNKAGYDLISYLPIINHFGFVKSENYEVLLIFDSKNELITERKFYDRAKSHNGLVCNLEIYSCIGKIY